jgi:hypothetical protein
MTQIAIMTFSTPSKPIPIITYLNPLKYCEVLQAYPPHLLSSSPKHPFVCGSHVYDVDPASKISRVFTQHGVHTLN